MWFYDVSSFTKYFFFFLVVYICAFNCGPHFIQTHLGHSQRFDCDLFDVGLFDSNLCGIRTSFWRAKVNNRRDPIIRTLVDHALYPIQCGRCDATWKIVKVWSDLPNMYTEKSSVIRVCFGLSLPPFHSLFLISL